jgi:hypothetical protein
MMRWKLGEEKNKQKQNSKGFWKVFPPPDMNDNLV